MNYVLFILPIAALIVTVFLTLRAVKNGKKVKSAVITQLAAFAIVCAVTVAVPVVANAATDEPANAALVTSLSGVGGGIAVAAAAPAAIGATAEDPKSFGKSLIFVALGEGIALYGLLISILILNKI